MITSKKLSPIEDGRAFLVRNRYNYLKLVGSSVDLVGINDRIDSLYSFFFKIKPNIFHYIKALLFGLPFQCAPYLDSRLLKGLEKIFREQNYDIVLLEMIRMHPLKKVVSSKKIFMDLDDILSRRYEQQLFLGNIDLGKYARFIPKSLNILFDNFKVLIFKYEIFKIKQLEMKVATLYDQLFLISPYESNIYERLYGVRPQNIPIIFKPLIIQHKDDSQSKDLLFVGNLSVTHNKDSINWILEKIFLERKIYENYGFILHIVGWDQDFKFEIEEKYKKYTKVSRNVDDLESFYATSFCCLMPLLYGTGIKIKILEAISFGQLIITNKIGAEGLFGFENILEVANTPEEIENKLKKYLILENRNKKKQLIRDHLSSHSTFLEKNLKKLETLFS